MRIKRGDLAKECEWIGSWWGAGWLFFLRAAAQVRTRETAGADNEIIPRGGASVRVFEAKPSPFFDIFVGFGEKVGGGAACSVGFYSQTAEGSRAENQRKTV